MKPLLITVGMGIGAEIAQKAANEYQGTCRLIFLGKREVLPNLPVTTLNGEEAMGVMSFEDGNDAAEVQAIEFAARSCLSGDACAMTTGPINKKRLQEKGFQFSGHTDFLGAICDSSSVMAFTGGALKVALVTTHIPLISVSTALNRENILHTVRTADHHLRCDLGIEKPRFAVCGLNPHAGEEGMLGQEEIELIHPCCEELRQEGIHVTGVVSAETAFLLAQQREVDMVVAMYHDQGLAPLKAVDFGRSVNWTLGLPIIRTSVDHGTAESLVGTGKADHSSLMAAIELAETIAQRHSQT